jgi:methionyl-tRNA formyltransferase
MKIQILTNFDLASLFCLNLLLPRLANHQLVIGLSDRVGAKHKGCSELQKLSVFEKNIIETPSLFVKYFPKLALSQQFERFLSFEQLSNNHDIAISRFNDINGQQGLSTLASLQPDFIISVRFGKILQQPVIDIPRLGVVNLHSGLLPNYQGVMATFWAMLNNESKIGCSLHYINDKRIDHGEIISQHSIPLLEKSDYLANLLELYIGGSRLILEYVSILQKQLPAHSHPQTGKSCYYSFPSASDITLFLSNGFSLSPR